MSDRKFASIRPSPLASFASMVGGFVGIGIGIAFVASVPSEPGPDGFQSVFFLFWFLVCGGMIVHGLYNLASFRKGSPPVPLSATEVVEIENGESGATDFAERLRKLESLRQDGLITEDEFQKKRKEILDDRW